MITISRQEVLKIAHMSNIMLPEHEIDGVIHQLSAVLSYAARVKEIATAIDEALDKNENVMRNDVSIPTQAAPILACAPEREATYFVVPAIIETSAKL
jgi:aspartyl/glutamyl-tRNA(Asn/Gln) amidotransferase C subunit